MQFFPPPLERHGMWNQSSAARDTHVSLFHCISHVISTTYGNRCMIIKATYSKSIATGMLILVCQIATSMLILVCQIKTDLTNYSAFHCTWSRNYWPDHTNHTKFYKPKTYITTTTLMGLRFFRHALLLINSLGNIFIPQVGTLKPSTACPIIQSLPCQLQNLHVRETPVKLLASQMNHNMRLQCLLSATHFPLPNFLSCA